MSELIDELVEALGQTLAHASTGTNSFVRHPAPVVLLPCL
jgi:hypothetical protein